MSKSIEAVVEEAFRAAKEAETAFILAHGEPMYCGFAWVNIKPGTSKIAKYLKEKHSARKSYYGGIDVWNPGNSRTQSMDIKEAGAQAFAKVLTENGFNAYAMSRAD